jgi:hypothetical protein
MTTHSKTIKIISVTTAALRQIHVSLPDLFPKSYAPANSIVHFFPATWNTKHGCWEIRGVEMVWYVPAEVAVEVKANGQD